MDFKISVALFALSLLAWFESPDLTASAGFLPLLLALVLFIVFSAVLMRLSKLNAKQAAVVSFKAFSVLVFVATALLFAVGFIPVRWLSNSLLLFVVIVFASVASSAYVFMRGVLAVDETAVVWRLALVFLTFFVLTLFLFNNSSLLLMPLEWF